MYPVKEKNKSTKKSDGGITPSSPITSISCAPLVSLLYNSSLHFTHSSPWTKFEKSIFKHFPMTSVFLVCLNGNGVQKRNSPSGSTAIHLPPIHFPSLLEQLNIPQLDCAILQRRHDLLVIRKESDRKEITRICPTSCTMV